MPIGTTRSVGEGAPTLYALRELGLLLDRPVLVATNLPRPKLVIRGSFRTRDQFLKYLEAQFFTNGIHLDLSGSGPIEAISVADQVRYQTNPNSIGLVPNRTYMMRIGPHEEPHSDGSMVTRHAEPKTLLWSYSDLVGKRVLLDANLPTNGVDFNPTSETMLAHEAKTGMEETLSKAGVSLIPAGNEIWAIPTADRARYQLPPVNVAGLSLLYTYSLIIALVCGTAGLPHILVRFYTNPDGVAAKRTTMWVMILIGIFYVFPPVFGVMGRNLLPSLYEGVGAKGTDKVVLELPRILNEGKGSSRGTPGPEVPPQTHRPAVPGNGERVFLGAAFLVGSLARARLPLS